MRRLVFIASHYFASFPDAKVRSELVYNFTEKIMQFDFLNPYFQLTTVFDI